MSKLLDGGQGLPKAEGDGGDTQGSVTGEVEGTKNKGNKVCCRQFSREDLFSTFPQKPGVCLCPQQSVVLWFPRREGVNFLHSYPFDSRCVTAPPVGSAPVGWFFYITYKLIHVSLPL